MFNGQSIIINSAVGILREDGWIFNRLLLQKLNTVLNKRIDKSRRVSLYMEDYHFLSNKRTNSLFSNSKNLNLSITISLESTSTLREESVGNIGNKIGNLIVYPRISLKEARSFSEMFLKSLSINTSKALCSEFEANNIVFKDFGEFYVSLIKNGKKESPRIIKK